MTEQQSRLLRFGVSAYMKSPFPLATQRITTRATFRIFKASTIYAGNMSKYSTHFNSFRAFDVVSTSFVIAFRQRLKRPMRFGSRGMYTVAGRGRCAWRYDV